MNGVATDARPRGDKAAPDDFSAALASLRGDRVINRRALVARAALIGMSAMSLRVVAQRKGAVPRVALVYNNGSLAEVAGPGPLGTSDQAFIHGLRDLGYIEGRTIIIERRSAEGHQERMAPLLKELIRLPVDVIVVFGLGAWDAQLATDTVPIVALVDTPRELGLVDSLARPGRNMTGQAGSAGPEMNGKRVELLKEAIPDIARVAVIDRNAVGGIAAPGVKLRLGAAEDAARRLGVAIIPVGVDKDEEFEEAFTAIIRSRAQALIVVGTTVNGANYRRIIDFVARQHLPSISDDRDWAEMGGLMGYGPNAIDFMRRTAAYVDKILKGTKPADLPFGQPTKFELTINLKTAGALGITIPRSLLLRADELIR